MSILPEQIDVGQTYVAFADQLERLVRQEIRAPEVVIEDACQFAWFCLVRHASRVSPEHTLSWLTRTARREAVRLARREARELSLDSQTVETIGSAACSHHEPHELAERRERLALLGHLPERQQRILWLHALGLTYAEIAVRSQCSPRTVERQLLRAKRTVRLAEAA